MFRILASVVFAFSILAASSSHASMLPQSLGHPNSLGHIPAEQASQSAADCGSAIKTFVIKPTPRCKAASHTKTGSLRCQVDIAPLTAKSNQFAAPRHLALGIPALNAPKNWQCAPILGPPRHA